MNKPVNCTVIKQDSKATQKAQDSGALDLWASVRRILELQNQAPDLTPLPRDKSLPMSFNQERLWSLDRLQPNNSAYNIPFAFRIIGDLDPKILEQSLQIILQRHEVLRTIFPSDSSAKGQKIQNLPPQILEYFELPNDCADRETEISKFIQEKAQAPFNLCQDILLRAILLKIGDREQILVINVHHIVFDGWSEGILWREISDLYEALIKKTEPELKPLPIQYADFSAWQRQWLQGNLRQALINYWQQNLDGDLQKLALPSDFPRPIEEQRRSACQTLRIPLATVTKLKKLARQEKATLFPTLLAAFKVLLFHYTQQTDICVSTPTANRNRSELKKAIGYFVNLLILRTDLAKTASFRQLIGQVKQAAFGASSHQDLPVQELASCLSNQAPLSQILFALQNTPQTPLTLSELKVERLSIDNGTADFDLFLSLTEEAGAINGVLKYNTDLFTADTINLLLQRYLQILDTVIIDPDLSLDRLLILTEGEQQQLARMRDRQAVPTSQQYVEPRNEIETKLVEIWQNILNLEQVGIRDRFFELGGTSLTAVTLFAQIETTFDQKLPLASLIQSPTIEQLAKVIQETDSVSWSPLVSLQPHGSRSPFFCVSGKGGHALNYRTLSNLLRTDRPFYGLQSRALDGKYPLENTIENIAADYIQEIKTVQPKGPYFLGGYSFGGTVAFEMAQQLRQQGEKVAILVFFDAMCNVSPLKKCYHHTINLLQFRVRPIVLLKYLLNIPYIKFQQQVRAINLFNFLSNSSSAKSGSTIENIRIRVGKANCRMLRKYKPQIYDGSLTLFRATERNDEQQDVYRDPEIGWGNFVKGSIEVYPIPTVHKNMLDKPSSVESIATKLQECLDRVDCD